MTVIIFYIWLFLSYLTASIYTQCEGFYKCCEGYSWNSTLQNCTKCETGYAGINCSIQCPFPTYGENCQKTCECIKERCDKATGCKSKRTSDSNNKTMSVYETNIVTTVGSTITFIVLVVGLIHISMYWKKRPKQSVTLRRKLAIDNKVVKQGTSSDTVHEEI